jgi:acetyltransferase-like isoleucine patch superfamily enzyme
MRPTKKDYFFNLFFKRALHFFPLFVVSIWVYLLVTFFKTHNFNYLIAFALTPYVLPLVCYRVLTAIYPIREGASYVGVNEKVFSPWLFSLRIQQIYIVFPQLERLLFFLPGMYATWLRLWGSKVGRNVFFVPNVMVHDRGFLELGDNIVFGDRAYLSSHILEVKNGRFMLYLKRIKIGSNVFVGAMTMMGPGTTIEGNTKIPAGSYYTINKSKAESMMNA